MGSTKNVQLVMLLLLMMTRFAFAGTYYVSLRGNDENPGTKTKPFRTIQKAADTLIAGDTCVIQGGTYHQTIILKNSGLPGKPIRFVAERDRAVILDGTESVAKTWIKHKDNIYKVKVKLPVEQLFVGSRMMVEARWPNIDLETQLLERKVWRGTVEGSRYGLIKDPGLVETDVDWTGAHITLNVAHQFFTWTRKVSSHSKGEDTLTYRKDLKGITHYANHRAGWEDDYYFLSGKLEALDRPTEWFYDDKKKLLYFYAPDGKDPSTLDVRYRVCQYGVSGKDLRHVEITGIDFFSCTFNFEKCSDMLIDRCCIRFPTYSRHVRSWQPSYRTGISGSHNVIKNCAISYASHEGLRVSGSSNLIENCLIHDVCWLGSLGYAGLNVIGEANISRYNTIYNGGNALLICRGGNQRVEYNHIYNGGRLCRDVSLIYTSLPECCGTVIHHNWVHGCFTEGFRGHGHMGGMGIRGDDQTRGLTIHHNVVWDCGIHGIVVKGDENRVFNNTIFDVGPRNAAERNELNSKHLLIPTRAESKKPWLKQFPFLKKQNANSVFYNNAVGNIVWRTEPLPISDKITHNLEFKACTSDTWLVDPDNMDFRPRKGSPLVDAGRSIPGFKNAYQGNSPDIGAYEYGVEPWSAGIRWNPKKVLGHAGVSK